jgi:drug/metabolite transporter (DMT)-like permease
MNGSMAIWPVLAILIATSYRRSRLAAGSEPTLRERVVLSLSIAAAFWAVTILSSRPKDAPFPPNADEWFALVFGVSLGAIPLVAFLLIDYSLRLTRRLESRYRLDRAV